MLERAGLRWVMACAVLAGCATPQPPVVQQPPPAPAVAAPQPAAAPPAPDVRAARAEEAKALLARAETDVQRARARRALWLKAWEELVASRNTFAAGEHDSAIRHARRASELARLGLEQLAYPAVK